MNYNEDPDDDGQAQRDERVERRILARKEREAALERSMQRHPAGRLVNQ
jgi:hypothetical protein